MRLLVTGGAGYIGSHVTRQLVEAGHQVTVYDNLCSGFRWATPGAPLVEADLADTARLDATLAAGRFEAVLHFAAHIVVPESVADPLKYYANNTGNTRNLLECCVAAGVKHFVFSSTAAVYGMPGDGICREDTSTQPINPYGMSKLMSEYMLADTCRAHGMRAVILRYFNVAGSDPEGEIGQSTPGSTLLIKVAAEAVYGRREQVYVYGTDYPTPDGTGVRDYIHVTDLAAAHVDALAYLEAGGDSVTLNCGYGRGYSVREVLDTVNRLAPRPLKVVETERRAGDPPLLIAEASRIKQVLGWVPRHAELDHIVRTSLDWEAKLAAREDY